MKNFALIGAAGFIAPRHMQAIKDTGNRLVVAFDPFDSVGIIDSYFPEADFFVEFERFDRHVYKLRRDQSGKEVQYVSICSPNYLHDAHIRFALRNHADAICEKPLVLNPWNVDALQELENETGQRVYNILQLRLHPSLVQLKAQVAQGPSDKIYDIDLTYIAGRGNWYHYSWKGDLTKSGGVATNIGVHFFDILSWIFGGVERNIVHVNDPKRAAGFMQFKRARVRWFLSVDVHDLPPEVRAKNQRTYRSIIMDGHTIEFSDGFTDLHTRCYEAILQHRHLGLDEARSAIEIIFAVRNAEPIGLRGDYHPFCKEIV
jgi:UDP-N-acetyl-2-amino-2-deoxyglucuronate dehydrogenase